jgi:hypothetical protein
MYFSSTEKQKERHLEIDLHVKMPNKVYVDLHFFCIFLVQRKVLLASTSSLKGEIRPSSIFHNVINYFNHPDK